MALPKLNAVPKYELTMPSTGKKHRYRPFLVKEEKVLLLAQESNDPKQMIYALADMVESCVEGVDKKTLAPIDVEYSFLKVRAKSVGETSELLMKCEKCEAQNPQVIDLDKIEPPVGKAQGKTKIDLGENIFVNLKIPSFVEMTDIDISAESGTETVFNLIALCVESIQTEDENINAKDVDISELKEFIESMSVEQFGKIREYIDTIPKLQHTIEYNCSGCGHENKVELEGVQSFF